MKSTNRKKQLGEVFTPPQLVNEMLDQLPPEVWSSSTTTFFDPAIGGGQLVKEIERRLKEAGHSLENIASRVFGMESDLLSVNYAVNTHKLVGNYQVGGVRH